MHFRRPRGNPDHPRQTPVLVGDKRSAWKTLIVPRQDEGMIITVAGAESAIPAQGAESWIYHSLSPSPVSDKVALNFYKAK